MALIKSSFASRILSFIGFLGFGVNRPATSTSSKTGCSSGIGFNSSAPIISFSVIVVSIGFSDSLLPIKFSVTIFGSIAINWFLFF